MHGSLYAFHGTKTDCIYSILRNGLRDLSNSHMMKVGAAMGSGIYVATLSSIAAGYSQDNAGFNQANYYYGNYQHN